MEYKRIEEYKGRIIIEKDEIFGAFHSCKKYDSLETIKAAIDNNTINSCYYPDDTMTMKTMI